MSKRLIAAGAVLAFFAACGESSTPVTPTAPPAPTTPAPTPPPTTNAATISIVPGAQVLTTTAYNPNPITVNTGTTITWMNADSIVHTSTSNEGAWDSGTLAPGATFSHTFNSAGTFTYHCMIHPNMIGTVSVQ